jgi:transposase
VKELERELHALLECEAGDLLELVGCSTLTAAKLVGEVAGVGRFAGDAKLAKHSDTAPLQASFGERQRHRLNRSGNRQLNCTLHRIAVTQARIHPHVRAYLERKQAEGKCRREALRCPKRHLAHPAALLRSLPLASPGLHGWPAAEKVAPCRRSSIVRGAT